MQHAERWTWMGRVALGALALAVAAGACGDDGGSGLDGDTTYDQLSDGEAMDFCEWSFSLNSDEEVARFTCYAAALIVSEGDRDTCETIVEECLDEAEPFDPTEACSEPDDLPACASEITVTEMERCAEQNADLLSDLARDVSCDDSADDLLDFELPPACLDIQEQCPDLFESSEEATAAAITVRAFAGRRAARGSRRR